MKIRHDIHDVCAYTYPLPPFYSFFPSRTGNFVLKCSVATNSKMKREKRRRGGGIRTYCISFQNFNTKRLRIETGNRVPISLSASYTSQPAGRDTVQGNRINSTLPHPSCRSLPLLLTQLGIEPRFQVISTRCTHVVIAGESFKKWVRIGIQGDQ